MIAVGSALRLQAPARGRETVGVLELAREVRAVGKARLVGDVGYRPVGVLDQPVGIAHAQLPVERGGTHPNMLPAKTLELTGGETELRGYRRDRDGARQVLLHEQQCAAHPRLADGLREWWVRLGFAAGARAVEQQHLARLLRDRAAEVLLDEIGCEGRGSGAAGAGDARP